MACRAGTMTRWDPRKRIGDMVPKRWTCLAAPILVILLCSGPARGQERGLQIAPNLNEFAFSLYRSLDDGRQNLIISPVSIANCLSILANGAEGETLASILNGMSCRGMLVDDLNRRMASLIKTLRSEKGRQGASDRFHVSIASRPWVNQNWRGKPVVLESEFRKRIAKFYAAPVLVRGCQDATTPREINDWVRRSTLGMIPTIVDRVDHEHAFALVNADSFEGTRIHQFLTSATTRATFFSAPSIRRIVPMMSMSATLESMRDDDLGVSAVALPYRHST